MSKEDVINYVMTTPSNPNKAVLEGMLDSIADAGSGTSEPLIVRATDNDDEQVTVLDKTWQEINEAFRSGVAVVLFYDRGAEQLRAISLSEMTYYDGLSYTANFNSFTFDSATSDGVLRNSWN